MRRWILPLLVLLPGWPPLSGTATAQTAPPPSPVAAAKAITSPKAFFGFDIGEDYCLANYQQMKGYWEKLAGESDRIQVLTIGTTEEGRPHLAALVSSPANLRDRDRYQRIARRLALAQGVDRAEARKLAGEGKAVVWIDAGIHASETLGPQAMIESVYQLLTANDEEALRILDDVIIVFVHANPDGHDLVADWYMRDADPKKRTLAGVPRLYQKYIGHDNNRDFYANTQAETKNMNRFMYREPGSRRSCTTITRPARRGPSCSARRSATRSTTSATRWSSTGSTPLGAAMVQRFLVEGKPGATSRSGSPVLDLVQRRASGRPPRSTTSSACLTETIGSPTPMQIPLRGDQATAQGGLPRPDRPATVAPPPVGRVLADRQPGRARLCLAPSRTAPLQHLADGPQRDRSRESR